MQYNKITQKTLNQFLRKIKLNTYPILGTSIVKLFLSTYSYII